MSTRRPTETPGSTAEDVAELAPGSPSSGVDEYGDASAGFLGRATIGGKAFENRARLALNLLVGGVSAAIGLVVLLGDLRNRLSDLLMLKSDGAAALGWTLLLGGAVWIVMFVFGPSIRRWGTSAIALSEETALFQIRPYDDSEESRKLFHRDDDEHIRIFNWLLRSQSTVLYLCGPSGCGKTSLLQAYVIPSAKERGWVAVSIDGVNSPLDQLRRALLSPGTIWSRPVDPAGRSTERIVQAAIEHLRRREGDCASLLLVFDQFEEIATLHERGAREVRGMLDFIRWVDHNLAHSNLRIVLVMRTNYEGRLLDFGLPSMRQGDNYEIVRLIGELSAMRFLNRGIRDASLVRRILNEAASIEGRSLRLRLITLNFLGWAAVSRPTLVRGSRARKGLLVTTLRDLVNDPAVRGVSTVVLRPLISSEQPASRPMSVTDLRGATGLSIGEIERVLRFFEANGLTRRHQNDANIWEISHDFVARVLQRVIDDLEASLMHRVRPWLAPLCGGVALFVLTSWGTSRYIRVEAERTLIAVRAREMWASAGGRMLYDAHGRLTVSFVKPHLVVDVDLLGAALKQRPELQNVEVLGLSRSAVSTLAGLPNLSRLTEIRLSGCTELSDLIGMPTYVQLAFLKLTGCSKLTTLEGLPDLPRLSRLDLRACSRLVSLEGMPGLELLESLDLTYCSRLSSLQHLPHLPRLEVLDLSDCDGLSSLDFSAIQPSLEHLDLSYIDVLGDLEGLPRFTPRVTVLRLDWCRSFGSIEPLLQLEHLDTVVVGDLSNPLHSELAASGIDVKSHDQWVKESSLGAKRWVPGPAMPEPGP